MTKMEWHHQPVTLLGLSKSGTAAARYLVQQGARCFLSETMPATPQNKDLRDAMVEARVEVEMGGHSARCFSHSDWVIVSPGIPPTASVIKELTLSGKTIWSEVELAYREADAPFVAITGTNGKTTTTTLIAAIAQAAGYNAPACGNIGEPIIGLMNTQPDWFVAELSSFQLQFSPSLRAEIAVYTNIRPDHLDWHGSVEAYKQAKAILFMNQQATDWAVLNADDPVCLDLAEHIVPQVFWFSRHQANVQQAANWISLDDEGVIVLKRDGQALQRLFPVNVMRLVGQHNQENVLASVAVSVLKNIPIAVIERAVAAFEGVEHRLERVAELDGITYYNDSKATNPDAALSALAAFAPQKVVLIAGGRDKKTDLSEFVSAVKTHVVHVVLMGEATERFEAELTAGGYTAIDKATGLQHAVECATRYASADTPVLFSPACASFDMFPNFEARGLAFKQCVLSLKPMVTS